MSSRSVFVKLSIVMLLGSWASFYTPDRLMMQSNATATATLKPAHEISQLVDVGGFRLYIHCTGQGTPAVIMDAGGNTASDTWDEVQPAVAQFTQVCTYDRAGLGKSDPGPTPTTSLEHVEQLHTLLENMSISSPYVLVGHSFGGMNMRLFASVYPTEVAGMVLVDAAHEDVFKKYFAFTQNGVDYKTSGEQVRETDPFPDIPLIVLRHGISGDLPVDEADWESYQIMLAELSPQSTLLVAEESQHFIHLDQPDLVIDLIRHMVATVQNEPGAPTLTPFWTPFPTVTATSTAKPR
jgi:pimeloyl-ACP methyl ester carboxylesterase